MKPVQESLSDAVSKDKNSCIYGALAMHQYSATSMLITCCKLCFFQTLTQMRKL